MTQTSTPRLQISPSEAETLCTHARTIVEGEGAEEFSPALVEAVALSLANADSDMRGYPRASGLDVLWGGGREHYITLARAALSTIRKHQAGE